MGNSKIPSCLGAKQLNRKKRKTADKTRGSQPRLMWEFENYIRERLRALGVIQ